METARSTIRLAVAKPNTITPTSCLQGTLHIDGSKLHSDRPYGSQLVICLSARRVHEKWRYRIDTEVYPFLTCSSKQIKMQTSTWSVDDFSLKSIKVGSKHVQKPQASAFSLAPATELDEEGAETFIFQLDGSLLNVDHLNPTITSQMDRDVIFVTASLRYTKPRKSLIPRLFQSNSQTSHSDKEKPRWTKTEYIRGAHDSMIVFVPQEGEASKWDESPTSYNLQEKDVLLYGNARASK